MAAVSHQHDQARVTTAAISCGAVTPELMFVQRGFDCTPIRVAFGMLQETIAPIARYWVGGKKGKQRECLTYAELLDKIATVRKKHKFLRAGTVEMMAQEGFLIWPEVHGPIVEENKAVLNSCPFLLERSNGSTMWAALDAANPALSLDSLAKLLTSLRAIVLSLPSDLASSCMRMKRGVAHFCMLANQESLKANGGVFVLIDVRCVGHIVHRIIESTFKSESLIPKLHSTSWSCSQPAFFTRVAKALAQIVDEDMMIGFFRGVPPPAALAHTGPTVLKFTLLRKA